jgi:hypothetical protein
MHTEHYHCISKSGSAHRMLIVLPLGGASLLSFPLPSFCNSKMWLFPLPVFCFQEQKSLKVSSEPQQYTVVLQFDNDFTWRLPRSLAAEVGLPPSYNEHLQMKFLKSLIETVKGRYNENIISHLRFRLATELPHSPPWTEQKPLKRKTDESADTSSCRLTLFVNVNHGQASCL